jgi:hypothetical protein
MNRIRILVATTAIVCFAFVGVAVASAAKVTGGTTTITASSATMTLLSTNHITLSPLTPATASDATFTFPIAGGKLTAKKLHGFIRHLGGLTASNGTKTVALRDPTIVSTRSGVSLWALVRGRSTHECKAVDLRQLNIRCLMVTHVRAARIATITDVTKTDSGASGTVRITAFTAGVLNMLAGKDVAAAGDTFGTATTAPTVN